MHTGPILLAISFVFTFTFSYASPASVQQKANEQEVLFPLTEEERLLNPRDLILNQPDFMADLSFFVAHRVSGHGFSQKLVRKGNRYREESEFWIFVGEYGKPSARLFPQAKIYDDYVPPRGGSLDRPPIRRSRRCPGKRRYVYGGRNRCDRRTSLHKDRGSAQSHARQILFLCRARSEEPGDCDSTRSIFESKHHSKTN